MLQLLSTAKALESLVAVNIIIIILKNNNNLFTIVKYGTAHGCVHTLR